MAKRPALIIFARAPVAGKAKTRLVPALGARRAAELYRCFLLDTLESARKLDAEIVVAVAEARDLRLVRTLAEEACPEARLIVQSGADLGQRIANAVRGTLMRGCPRAVVIGSDSPSLPPRLLREALDLSPDRDLVLGPCYDGGYYLIGLRAFRPELFSDIAWGSENVLIDTLRRAEGMELSVALLEPWHDVDTPEDLRCLHAHLTAQSLAAKPISCPRTWQYLCDLGEEALP